MDVSCRISKILELCTLKWLWWWGNFESQISRICKTPFGTKILKLAPEVVLGIVIWSLEKAGVGNSKCVEESRSKEMQSRELVFG